MGETRRSFDPEFRAGAVRIVRETGKSIASVANDLGINAGTLANWMQMDRLARERDADGELSESEREELKRIADRVQGAGAGLRALDENIDTPRPRAGCSSPSWPRPPSGRPPPERGPSPKVS